MGTYEDGSIKGGEFLEYITERLSAFQERLHWVHGDDSTAQYKVSGKTTITRQVPMHNIACAFAASQRDLSLSLHQLLDKAAP
jgi:hypothetical protein